MADTVPFLSLEHPIRMAHRGSTILWPENTLPAFQGAVDLGYRYIETDVRMTRDGVVVVFHDPTLERLTNGVGKVEDWLYEDLARLDAAWSFGADRGFPLRADGVRVPTLAEAFDTYPDVHFNLDLKAKGIEWAVADVIKRHGREDSTMVGSFTDRRLSRIRRITRGRVATSAGPAQVAAMLAASRIGRTGPKVDAYQVPIRSRGIKVVDKRFVKGAHRSGAQVHVWTINDPDEMNALLDLGVDGIVTDRPDLLREVVSNRLDGP